MLAARIRAWSRRWIGVVLIAAGCGCGGATPTNPNAPVQPQVAIAVAPNPLKAAFVRSGETGAIYRISADVSIIEKAGLGGQVNQVTTSITTTQLVGGFSTSTTLSQSVPVALQLAAFETLRYPLTQELGFSSGDFVIWRFHVSGADSQGRPFSASSGDIPIQLDATSGTGGT